MTYSEEKVKQIITEITKILIDSMEDETIDRESAQMIAEYILEEKKKIVDEASLNQFLKNLSDKYFFFSPFVDSYFQKENLQRQDLVKIEQIKNQLNKFIN